MSSYKTTQDLYDQVSEELKPLRLFQKMCVGKGGDGSNTPVGTYVVTDCDGRMVLTHSVNMLSGLSRVLKTASWLSPEATALLSEHFDSTYVYLDAVLLSVEFARDFSDYSPDSMVTGEYGRVVYCSDVDELVCSAGPIKV